MSKYTLSPRAKQDIADIQKYTNQKWGSEQTVIPLKIMIENSNYKHHYILGSFTPPRNLDNDRLFCWI